MKRPMPLLRNRPDRKHNDRRERERPRPQRAPADLGVARVGVHVAQYAVDARRLELVLAGVACTRGVGVGVGC